MSNPHADTYAAGFRHTLTRAQVTRVIRRKIARERRVTRGDFGVIRSGFAPGALLLAGLALLAVPAAAAPQPPSPPSIVARLMAQVPQLAQDVPGPASSYHQGAGGRSAGGSVDAAERGRLVPAPIPGHPWSSVSRAPHRGVAVSVAWKSGPVTVSVLYSASRGRSTTSVSAATR